MSASISTISDNFNDNSTNLSLWGAYATTGSQAETSGWLVLTLASNNAGYSGYTSSASYDLTGSQATIQVIQAISLSTGCEQILNLILDGNNQLAVMLGGGSLLLRLRSGGSNSDTTVTWNPTTMAWWRLRESSGTIYWDTSADGISWTNQRSASNPFAVTSLQVGISAGTYQSVASPGVGIFDNFNALPQTPATSWIRL